MLTFPFLGPGVYIWWNGMVEWNGGMEWWNGMVEWNGGMDYWNGGMLHRTYLIIQHVLYSEQWALRCVLCMRCWRDGWLARLVLHCMNFELWPRPGYTFTLQFMQGNQAPQYVSHLITNCHFSFFTYCMTEGVSWTGSKFKVQSSYSAVLASQPSSQQCMQRTQRRAHCSPFHYSIPPNVDIP